MELYSLLLKNLEQHITKHAPNHSFKDVYTYSLLPAGKLFRPLLAANVFSDLTSHNKTLVQLEDINSALANTCSALEVHHTYTLIHDDMPCMDNDDLRRGRESTHKKFGEWKALLAGDGLLNLSYRLLSLGSHSQSLELIKFASWSLGTKGLIQGQALDLNIQENNKFSDILLIHKLKTARLIQLSLVAGATLANNKPLPLEKLKNMMRLGEALGLTFQLLDDLIDLYEDEQEHESEINPWIHHFELTSVKTNYYITQTQQLLKKYELKGTNDYINSYISKSHKKFLELCPKKHVERYRDLLNLLSTIN